MKGKVHGARPLLTAEEARRQAGIYVAEVDQGVVRSYADYLALAGDTKLPQALGSLVFHYGQRGRSRAHAVVGRRHLGWDFHASALRTYGLTLVELNRQRRPWHIGPLKRDTLVYLGDESASGQTVHTGRQFDFNCVNQFWQSDPEQRFGAHGEQLAGFLATSQLVIQELLDTTAALEQSRQIALPGRAVSV